METRASCVLAEQSPITTELNPLPKEKMISKLNFIQISKSHKEISSQKRSWQFIYYLTNLKLLSHSLNCPNQQNQPTLHIETHSQWLSWVPQALPQVLMWTQVHSHLPLYTRVGNHVHCFLAPFFIHTSVLESSLVGEERSYISLCSPDNQY